MPIFSATPAGTGFRREPDGTTREQVETAGRRVFMTSDYEGDSDE